jgi:hypothetical protein
MVVLWRQVLEGKYGVVREDIGDGGRKASELWKDIISIRKGFFNRIVG